MSDQNDIGTPQANQPVDSGISTPASAIAQSAALWKAKVALWIAILADVADHIGKGARAAGMGLIGFSVTIPEASWWKAKIATAGMVLSAIGYALTYVQPKDGAK